VWLPSLILVVSVVVVSVRNEHSIRNSVVAISWVSNSLGNASGSIWMLDGLSMEWHVLGVLQLTVPLVSILMWLHVLEEVIL